MSPTLILSPANIEDSTKLWRAAIDANWSVERLHGWKVPAWLTDREIVVYGEGWFANLVAEELDLALIQTPFDWLVNLPAKFLKRHIEFATLKEARQVTETSFIKPAEGKWFEADVYESGTALELEENLEDSAPVLIAEPITWEVEFRCFVLNRQVVTLSPYFRFGELVKNDQDEWLAEPDEIEEAKVFVKSFLQEVDTPSAFVLDVGVIQDKGWAVVEANPVWASGIYGCDPAKVLAVLHRACIKRFEITDDDIRWIITD